MDKAFNIFDVAVIDQSSTQICFTQLLIANDLETLPSYWIVGVKRLHNVEETLEGSPLSTILQTVLSYILGQGWTTSLVGGPN